jgi:hypothetical protein
MYGFLPDIFAKFPHNFRLFLHVIILPDEVTKFPDVFLAEASGVRALSGGRHEIGDVAVAG